MKCFLILFSLVLISIEAPRRSRAFLKNNTVVGSNNTNLTQKEEFVESDPFEIKFCNQTLLIEGNYINNISDFSKKTPGVLTMSIYLINLFSSKSPDKLINSVEMDRIEIYPSILEGTKRLCIMFKDHKEDIAFCLKDEVHVGYVLAAYKQYMKCRLGDDLKEEPLETIKTIFKNSCLGLDIEYDPKIFDNDANKAKAALQSSVVQALKDIVAKSKSSISSETPQIDVVKEKII